MYQYKIYNCTFPLKVTFIHFLLQFYIFFSFLAALELTFNGSYRVKYILSNRSNIRKEKYAFRIKTTQENALLFMARGPQNHNDLIQIEVKSWRIRLTVNFGHGICF